MTHAIFESKNIEIIDQGGVFKVIRHKDDLSIYTPQGALVAYYMKQQNIHKRQIVAELNGNVGCIMSAGAMQMTAGNVDIVSNVKGVGDLIGKAIKGRVTGESAIKPLYRGAGVILTEPTYKHLFIVDVGQSNGLVVSDGMFLACEDTVDLKVVTIKTLSGALLGKEGLFNLGLFGRGYAVLECPIPYEELTCITVRKGEKVCIDGPYAVMWEDSLSMSVEKSTRSLLGSSVSGEGLVNVFQGEGSVWVETAAATVAPGV